MREKLIAIFAVTTFFGLIWLYVREFPALGNTLYIRIMLILSGGVGLLIAGAALLVFKKRFIPWGRHLPEILTISVACVLFMPLALSLLNRAGGQVDYESFEFVSETPYLSSPYGVLKGEKIKPTGYRLRVLRENRLHAFRYKKQAYFPLTKPGEKILLPIRHGLLGFPVLELR
ncbi:MAG: hypothetical protein ACR2K1_12265 [Saprospiraceae bacterium]